MTFDADKCGVLSVSKNDSQNNYTSNNKVLGHSNNESDLGVRGCLIFGSEITVLLPEIMLIGSWVSLSYR